MRRIRGFKTLADAGLLAASNATRKLAHLGSFFAALAGGTVSAATLHVWPDSPNPTPPYESWANAATNIQDAVDAAADGDTVLVAGGLYSTGGRAVVGAMTNRVAIDKAIGVESLMGPEVTVIEGAPAPGGGVGEGAIRCVYLGANAVLSGFTLTNGHTLYYGGILETDGGGGWCEDSASLTNCIVTGNVAFSSGGGTFGGKIYNCTLTNNGAVGYRGGGSGGGAKRGTLYQCLLTDNSSSYGGGASDCILYNCTLVGNAANRDGGGANGGAFYNCTLIGNRAGAYASGGGVANGALHNSIVCFNTAPHGPNHSGSTFNYSCTTPLPGYGTGNITNAPLFVDLAAGDLHLRYGSPGIDAGADLSTFLTTDLDGNSRPLDGDGDGLALFDMGAYEFDARSIVPQEWFTRHGLDPGDPQVVSGNPDGDAFTTFQEWLADTDPSDPISYFHIDAISKTSPVIIWLQSSSNRNYRLWRTPQLSPPDWMPAPGAQTIPGNGGTLMLIDSANPPRQFYRVQVSLP